MRKIISYLKAGILLHIVTTVELTIFIALYNLLPISGWLSNGYWALKICLLIPFINMPIFAQFDAWSRFQNYKLIKDHLYVYGFQPRIIKPFIKSRCQRDAVFAAAKELGMASPCTALFKSYGYKWYHYFPDVIFAEPKVLLTKNFWLTTLFVKYYRPKFDYTKIIEQEKEIKKPSFQIAS